jgi:hypothetical protein
MANDRRLCPHTFSAEKKFMKFSRRSFFAGLAGFGVVALTPLRWVAPQLYRSLIELMEARILGAQRAMRDQLAVDIYDLTNEEQEHV